MKLILLNVVMNILTWQYDDKIIFDYDSEIIWIVFRLFAHLSHTYQFISPIQTAKFLWQ